MPFAERQFIKMKKKRIYTVSVILLLAMLVPNLLVSVSAFDGCITNPDDYNILWEDCDTEDGCGFLWLKDTKIVRKQYFCKNNDLEHRQWCSGILYTTVKDGCC